MIPLTALLEHTASNDTPSSYFRRPTLNNASLDKFIGFIPVLKAKKDLLYKVRKDNNVKPLDAVAYWGRPDVVAIYGSYAVTYATISGRNVGRKKMYQAQPKRKAAEMDPEKREKQRVKINAQADARKKRYKAERKAADEAKIAADDTQRKLLWTRIAVL